MNGLKIIILILNLSLWLNFEKFYEYIFKFLTGIDTTPRIFHSVDNIISLPPGHCAHEMPDQVELWITEIQNAEENLSYIFPELIDNTYTNLSGKNFDNLCTSLKNGIKKSSESFQKWLKC